MLRTVIAPIRTLIGVPLAVIWTIVCATGAMIAARFRPTSPATDWFAAAWGKVLIALAGVRTTIEGLEHVDTAQSYVFVSNHISGLDPPFHLAKMPVGIRFLAKKELFKVPIFGPGMRSIGMVETDRTAGVTAHRKINEQVAYVIEIGRSLMVYPEGTRSRDGEMKTFKKGAFRIAIDNGMPIVPVTISGTEQAWPVDSKLIRGGRVKMVFGEPILTTDLDAGAIDDLRDCTRAVMLETYDRIRAELDAG